MPVEPWQSNLWKSGFQHTKDGHDDERDRLQHALRQMRDSVGILVTRIQADCPQLTIHDLTHLDALWETADLISGTEFTLNPAETFVFGAAILLHDAALTVAAYERGLEGIKETDIWKDTSAAFLNEKANFGTAPVDETDIEQQIIFVVLRDLHAKQAEKLANMQFNSYGYLIQDSELRDAFAETIGIIANSHHWDIEKITSELNSNIGASMSLPNSWSVNRIKIACLLRCADAAHFDRNRAPSILLNQIKDNTSKLHWLAQNKLNKLSLDNDSILISSASSFNINESDAWWTVYELARILENEISKCNSLLSEFSLPQFRAKRVSRISTPHAFSNIVSTSKWNPVDSSIKVSDPLRISRMLGGKNLYGNDILVPFRELIQNAADAVRALRKIQNRDSSWGLINISICKCEEDDQFCWIYVDDTGIGMSERVLSGPLVDFGNSLWNSNLLREEFPKLRRNNFSSIGKFGIGFFSVFDFSKELRVISKRYDKGYDAVNILDFGEKFGRAIIHQGSEESLPPDISTRVIWKAESCHITDILERKIKTMTAFMDININYANRISDFKFFHGHDIGTKDPDVFFDELLCIFDKQTIDEVKEELSSRMTNIYDSNGKLIGRAAIDLYRGRQRTASLFESKDIPERLIRPGIARFQSSASFGFIHVGGITVPNKDNIGLNYVGVVSADTRRVSRDKFEIYLPKESKENWIRESIEKIDFEKYDLSEQIQVGQDLYFAGFPQRDIPILFSSGKYIDYIKVRSIISQFNEIIFPIDRFSESWISLMSISSLYAMKSDGVIENNIIFLNINSEREKIEFEFDSGFSAYEYDLRNRGIDEKIDPHEITLTEAKSIPRDVRIVDTIATEEWGVKPHVFLTRRQLYGKQIYRFDRPRPCVVFSKVPPAELETN